MGSREHRQRTERGVIKERNVTSRVWRSGENINYTIEKTVSILNTSL